MFKLVFETDNRKVVELGKVYKDFRDEEWMLDGFRAPTHPGSTGRVYVHKPNKDVFDTNREFFPSVLGMKIIWEELEELGE